MAELSAEVLTSLCSHDEIDTLTLSGQLKVEHEKVVGAVKSLQSKGDLINCVEAKCKRWMLTPEGQLVADNGSHEAVVFSHVPPEGIVLDDLMKSFSNAKIGFGKAKASGWVELVKGDSGQQKVVRKVEKIVDTVQLVCRQIGLMKFDEIPDDQKKECKKRNLVREEELTYYIVTKGSSFSTSVTKQETDLTADMINSGSWKEKQFKALNFNACGKMPDGGHLHPLLKVRTQFRQIFLEMGFTEMPTNNYVESSFWNFDALFQPQQHPARDAHDTFFLADPMKALKFPMDYVEKVKKVHSVGGYGSQGYQYDWKVSEAAKNIMRTHTTAVSARMLYKLAQQDKFHPAKYFSIDRVFRNEALDATHLAEFHQIEGLVADYGLTLGNMMGIIEQFFKKCGIKKLRFKPAYNPYTEPSMEIFSYHDGLKKWVEVGNSGVFRPEMLLPMGFPPGVSVIAWGLSLERPTMIKYGIQNIRDLFGPRINLHKVYTNPLCRLDK